MTVLVCGGRNYADKDRVTAELDRIAKRHFDANGGVPDEYGNWMPLSSFKVVHGGCNCRPDDPKIGADFWANEWCICNWTAVQVFWANWYPDGKTFDRSAGPKRNSQMLRESKPDLVLAFPGNNGTADMVRKARKANVPVVEVKS